jgi:hypothetical protein
LEGRHGRDGGLQARLAKGERNGGSAAGGRANLCEEAPPVRRGGTVSGRVGVEAVLGTLQAVHADSPASTQGVGDHHVSIMAQWWTELL